MIKVLHILDGMNYGGIQAFIMNVYRKINLNEVRFDFLLNNDYPKNYYEEIKKLGGHIFFVTPRNKGILKNINGLNAFFKKNKYDVVHFHESSLSYITPLIVAKKYGVKTRIIHSHSTHIDGGFFHKALHFINKKRIHKFATHYFACGEMAASWMFSKTKCYDKVKLIRNGIILKNYEFKDEIRNKIRRDYNLLSDSLVIGHIGRFETVKNHSFLLDVFSKIIQKKPNSILMLVGDGSLITEIKDKAKVLKIDDKIKFLGVINNVNEILQAIDVFVLPSLFEGFPISLIEAEAVGIPAVVSDSVSKEVGINLNVHFLPLDKTLDEWSEIIISCVNKNDYRDKVNPKIKEYDIENVISILMEVYHA